MPKDQIRRGGKLRDVWLATFLPQRVTRQHALRIHVPRTCEDILEYIDEIRWVQAVIRSAHLIKGVTRIHQQQVDFFETDLCRLLKDATFSLRTASPLIDGDFLRKRKRRTSQMCEASTNWNFRGCEAVEKENNTAAVLHYNEQFYNNREINKEFEGLAASVYSIQHTFPREETPTTEPQQQHEQLLDINASAGQQDVIAGSPPSKEQERSEEVQPVLVERNDGLLSLDRPVPPPEHLVFPPDLPAPPPDLLAPSDLSTPPPDHFVPPPEHPVLPPDLSVPPPDHPVPPPDHPVPPPDHPVLPLDHPVPLPDLPVPPEHPVLPPDFPVPPPEHPVLPPVLSVPPPDHPVLPLEHPVLPPDHPVPLPDLPVPPEHPVLPPDLPVPPLEHPVLPPDLPVPPPDHPVPPKHPVPPPGFPVRPLDLPVPPPEHPVLPLGLPVPPLDLHVPPPDLHVPPPDLHVPPPDLNAPPPDLPVPPPEHSVFPVDHPIPPPDHVVTPERPVLLDSTVRQATPVCPVSPGHPLPTTPSDFTTPPRDDDAMHIVRLPKRSPPLILPAIDASRSPRRRRPKPRVDQNIELGNVAMKRNMDRVTARDEEKLRDIKAHHDRIVNQLTEKAKKQETANLFKPTLDDRHQLLADPLQRFFLRPIRQVETEDPEDLQEPILEIRTPEPESCESGSESQSEPDAEPGPEPEEPRRKPDAEDLELVRGRGAVSEAEHEISLPPIRVRESEVGIVSPTSPELRSARDRETIGSPSLGASAVDKIPVERQSTTPPVIDELPVERQLRPISPQPIRSNLERLLLDEINGYYRTPPTDPGVRRLTFRILCPPTRHTRIEAAKTFECLLRMDSQGLVVLSQERLNFQDDIYIDLP